MANNLISGYIEADRMYIANVKVWVAQKAMKEE